MDALGTLPGEATRNTWIWNLTLPCKLAPLNGRIGYAWCEARRCEIYAPMEELNAAMGIIAIALYNKGCIMLVSPL